MRFLLFPLFLLWPLAAPAGETVISPEEAQAALRSARWPGREPGSWQASSTRETKAENIAELRQELRETGRPVLRRVETTRRSKQHPERVRTSVVVNNAEGEWELFAGAALRRPALLESEELAKLRTETMAKLRGEAERLKAEGRTADPAARAELKAQYASVSGFRRGEGNEGELVIRLKFGPEAQKLMREVADAAWKQQKKRLSFAVRLIAAPIYAAKRDDFIPAEQETVIDAATGLIRSQTNFSRDGKAIGKPRAPAVWQPAGPFSADLFALPAGLRRLEPKSLAEWEKLRKQLRDEPAETNEAAAEAAVEATAP